MTYLTELLNRKHSKQEFCCGKEMLDQYLHRQAGQDVKRKLSACFVAIDNESGLIQGYYTLSNCSIPLDGVPEALRKKLPKSYHTLPATLLGRLAVDQRFHGQGLGKRLLIDALKRTHDAASQVGSFAVVVDPLDTDAENFYAKYGFIHLPDSGKMFLAMKTVERVFG